MFAQDDVIIEKYLPNEILKYIKLFFCDDDVKLIQILIEKPMSATEISSALGFDASDIIQKAYSKELVKKIAEKDSDIQYCLLPAAVRVNNAAVFERDLWESIAEEDIKVLTDWHYSNFLNQKATSSLGKKQENLNCVLPLDQAVDYLKQNGEVFTIIPCDCHCKSKDRGYDKNVCICFGEGINTHADRGLGERKTLEETIDLLKLADELGLVHSGEKDNLCNCNVKYCYPMRASIDLELEHQWPQTEYCIEFSREKCINCKLCIKRCQFNVFTVRDDYVACNQSKCWGCGLCVARCPGKALSITHI